MLVHSIVTKHESGKCLELDGSTIFQPSCRNGIIWQTLWYLMPKAFRRILIQWYWWCSTRPTAGLPALPATWPIQDPMHDVEPTVPKQVSSDVCARFLCNLTLRFFRRYHSLLKHTGFDVILDHDQCHRLICPWCLWIMIHVDDRRKFRSQTSDNYGQMKSRAGKRQREEKD